MLETCQIKYSGSLHQRRWVHGLQRDLRGKAKQVRIDDKSYDRHMFIRDNKLDENDGKRLICVDQGSTMGGDLG